VFLVIIIVLTLPIVSIPNDKGKTSSNKTLLISPSGALPSLEAEIISA
jgi:hypothetical protein